MVFSSKYKTVDGVAGDKDGEMQGGLVYSPLELYQAIDQTSFSTALIFPESNRYQTSGLPAFYVKDIHGTLVAAQFLSYNGNYIKDPNSYDSGVELYDSSGNVLGTDTNGYLITPQNYTISNAQSFASQVFNLAVITTNGNTGFENMSGIYAALGMMSSAFGQGGSQDLQRTYNGITNGPVVQPFIDAASYNLGLVTACAGLPESWSEAGGGAKNQVNSWYQDILGTLGYKNTPIDTSGTFGLSQRNQQNIESGFSLATSLPGCPSNSIQDPNPSTVAFPGSKTNGYTSGSITGNPNSGEPEVNLNLTAGGSQDWLFNPTSGVGYETNLFSQSGQQGAPISQDAYLIPTNGSQVDQAALSGFSIYVTTGTNANLNGNNDSLFINGAGTLGVTGAGESITDTVGGATVNLGAGSSAYFSGVNTAFNLANNCNLDDSSATGVRVNINPNCMDGIHCAGNQVTLNGGDSLTDEGDQVNVGNGQTDTLNGYNDNLIAGSSDNLTLGSGSINGTTCGVGDNINLGAGDTLTNNTGAYSGYLPSVNVTLSANATDTLAGNTGDGVNLAANDTVNGSGNLDFFTGGYDDLIGASNTVIESGSGTITGSGDTFSNSFGATNYTGLTDVLIGNNDKFTQAAYDGLFLTGIADTVNGVSGDTIALNANSAATVTNTGETIDLNGNNAGAAGNGDFFGIFATGDSVTGAFNQISMSGTQTAFLTGNADVVNQYIADTLGLTGVNDTVNGKSGDAVVFIGNSDAATVTNSGENIGFWSGNDTVTGSGETYTWNTLGGPENNVNEFVTGSNNIFNVTGTGDNLGLMGTSLSDTVNGQAGGGLIFLGGGDSATVTNTGENVDFWSANDTVTSSNALFSWNTLAGPEVNVGETLIGSNDGGTLATGDGLGVTGSYDVFTASNGDLFNFSGYSGATDGFYLANSNTNATGVFNRADGTSQEQIYNPNGSTFAQILDYSKPNDGGNTQDQTWEYDNGTSASDLYNANVSGGVQEADLSYDTPDAIFGTTTALANDYYKALLDLTSAAGGGSQVQLYDNTGSALPQGVTMEYTDYASVGGGGAEQDTTTDFTNTTSITTDFNPEAGVASVTGTFSGLNDSGNLENLNFGYNANGHDFTFDDRFTYSGNTQLDIYQSVYNASGQRTGYAEFNAQNDKLVQDFQGNYGYAGSGFSYNYAYGFGYGSNAATHGEDISAIGVHGELWKGSVSVAHGDPSVRGKHRPSAAVGGIAQIIAAASQTSTDVPLPSAAVALDAATSASTNQLVHAISTLPGQPISATSPDFWDRLETSHGFLAAVVR